ncbi:MAG TPA: alpha/beta fold hydrolase [Ktedonobacteraceae bacterium]|nr:alpha/beta fold hydrolase [Ktedonobacteraceae bacterium]
MAKDERVQSAIDNWAPRFISNGVDANDFQRVTNSIDVWDEWCQKWSECGVMHEQMAEQAESRGYTVSAAYHYFHAAISYHFGKYLFVHRPQELRAAHEHVVRDYRRALPYFDMPGEHVAMPYEGGASMYGIFRKPAQVARPPVVILVPGLDSVKEELHLYGDDFLRRGMAVLAIDGPGQGEMEFEFPLRHDYEVPVARAIDYLETRPDVDASRVGLMGVSFGGQFAVRAAAFERRLKAVIENCGSYNQSWNFKNRPQISRDTMVHRLKVANEEEALDRLQHFNLQGVAEKVGCPRLVIQGRRDRLVSAEQGERIAAEAGRMAELWMFEDGNHVCNNIPYKHRPQQADWMREKLYASE